MLVLKSLRYLARQGSALRGDKDEGNLIQLVKLMGNNDPKVCYFFLFNPKYLIILLFSAKSGL